MAVRLSSNFVLRKLHQLSGIVPLGAFLLEHLYTNSKAVHPQLGEQHFNDAVKDLQAIPYIIFVEITFIFIPLIYHAVFGLFITWESRPNNLSYPAIGAAAALCWAWPDRDVTDILLGLGFAVGIAAVLFVFGEVFGRLLGVSATPFGLGDVKLILLIGLLLGWPVVMSALFIGVIIAGVPAIALMLSGRSRGVFAYGPYLALGALAGLLWFDRFD